MANKINVVFCIDNSYAQQLGATIASLCSFNDAKDLKIFIVSPILDPTDKSKLEELGKSLGAELVFRQVNEDLLSGLKVHLHFSPANYYRLLLPEIISELDKVIYMDSDVIIETNIQELWDTNIDDYACAGLEETSITCERLNNLGLTTDFYINSGILVLNLNYWRANRTTERCIDWLVANPQKVIMVDQDAINVVLLYMKIKISKKWNLTPIFDIAPAQKTTLIC